MTTTSPTTRTPTPATSTTTAPATMRRTALPTATTTETLNLVTGVAGPVLAKGVIIRRPKVMAIAGKLDLGRRSVKIMQRLRNKYGTGPLLTSVLGRRHAVILSPEHVHRVLSETPEPFATATKEKRAALSHFEPKNALISHGPERAERRRFNDEVLDSNQPVHRLADSFLPVVHEEAERLLGQARRRGELIWDDFIEAWFRMVRQVIFGVAARDDKELTDMIAELRSTANWVFLAPKRRDLREQFYIRLSSHIARAEPGSLASIMAATGATDITAPTHQVPQWLFAFDPAAMTTFRALALLATHPDQDQQAREEIRERTGEARQNLPYLRACVLESLRLWPTTPAVLRETTRETEWEHGVMPAKTNILIFAPFFHRDDQRLPYANRFAPQVWLEKQPPENWPLIPFSSGPAVCPGRNLVLLLTSAMLAELLDGRQVRVQSPVTLTPHQPLPGSELNNYALRFQFHG
jgi:cytochrome P450